MSFPSKGVSVSNISLKDKNEIVFNGTKNCSIFKSFFFNLVQKVLSKLLLSPNIFTESRVASYYDNINFKDLNFDFFETSPDKNFLKGLNPCKAAGIDNLSGKFLKDGFDILSRPIYQLFNLSLSLSLSNSIRSLEVVKLQKSNCFLKKAPKLTLKTTAPFTSPQLLRKY